MCSDFGDLILFKAKMIDFCLHYCPVVLQLVLT